MMISDDEHIEHSQSSTELGKVARAVSGLTAAGLGAAGVVGVFAEDTNSGGVPALLILAAFLGYLAIYSQRLTRLEIGEQRSGFDRVVKVVTRSVLEDPAVPAETKGDVAEALGEVRPALRRRTRLVVGDAIDFQAATERYENAVHSAVTSLAQTAGYGGLPKSRTYPRESTALRSGDKTF
jgi:hypothetical protein